MAYLSLYIKIRFQGAELQISLYLSPSNAGLRKDQKYIVEFIISLSQCVRQDSSN